MFFIPSHAIPVSTVGYRANACIRAVPSFIIGHMDYERWYASISSPFRGAFASKTVNVLDKALVYVIAAAYVVTAAIMAATQNPAAIRFIAVPAFTFAAVTVARRAIDAPRPYELHEIQPIIVKDTHGKSLPSRHVASAVAIACAFFYMNAPCGIVAFIASAIVSLTRIVGGVHYPRDVAAAIIASLAIGIAGFALIP